jgi:hypothetical protein
MTRQERRNTLSDVRGVVQIDRLGDLWCTFMHTSPMWPIHGQYECGACGRRHPVPWAERNENADSPEFSKPVGGSHAGHQVN